MTYEEAREFYNNRVHHFASYEESEKDQECRKIINEALEKQIPKGIIHLNYLCKDNGQQLVISCCAKCKMQISNVVANYCWYCGQKIDWSDKK